MITKTLQAKSQKIRDRQTTLMEVQLTIIKAIRILRRVIQQVNGVAIIITITTNGVHMEIIISRHRMEVMEILIKYQF